MKFLHVNLALGTALCLLLSHPVAAAETNYRIVQRIKVPDGGFDYATFDTVAERVYMPRGAFTTVIDAKTGAVSRFANGEANHIALRVPGTNFLVLTQGGKGIIRILDKTSDTVLADLPAG